MSIHTEVEAAYARLKRGEAKFVVVKPQTLGSLESDLVVDVVGEAGATHADLLGHLDERVEESRSIIYRLEYKTKTQGTDVLVDKEKIVVINWVPKVLLEKGGLAYTRRKMFAPTYAGKLKKQFNIDHIIDGIEVHAELTPRVLVDKAGRFERDPIDYDSVK
eukprot:TRINITY_DN27846_c0_g1_i1.p1 TRINITY_DN27846_c0_g1~~TRINITY_DN27846_c0_g1_i1.p1  ORF type:complete len:162 (-),score=16.06 TRINITY_DN27846_c0_g1_i1:31-516(-)